MILPGCPGEIIRVRHLSLPWVLPGCWTSSTLSQSTLSLSNLGCEGLLSRVREPVSHAGLCVKQSMHLPPLFFSARLCSNTTGKAPCLSGLGALVLQAFALDQCVYEQMFSAVVFLQTRAGIEQFVFCWLNSGRLSSPSWQSKLQPVHIRANSGIAYCLRQPMK